MVFNHDSFDWEKVVDEVKVLAWRILRTRAKGFSFNLSNWFLNPLVCIGASREGSSFRSAAYEAVKEC
ncbi:hypothetical protein A2U01_0053694 [Trifolium medium]|uniref:Uncharacterized protein n=1 Tax=Trifolium medium TaxID=97028 RepID=A0A392R9P1_9FABA|nr:hypothetical protein [Trifolium medium]